MDVSVFFSDSNDPYFNLALEDWIFKNRVVTHPVLFFYVNKPAVIIGRAQNPWLECDLKKMAAEGVLLARRQSGGGAVYHDLGNLNFSVLAPLNYFDKAKNLACIMQALEKFNIKATMGPRHDLWVGNQKISGCAFRQTKDKAFHHGTLLINTDLDKLNHYLRSPVEHKIQAKGVKSVRSTVVNLAEFNSELTAENLILEITNNFAAEFNLNTERVLKTPAELINMQMAMEEAKSFEWLYGRTLPFELRELFTLPSGKQIEASLKIEQGIVTSVSVSELDYLMGRPFNFFS